MISSTQTNQPFVDNYVDSSLQVLRQAGHRITQVRIELLKALSRRDAPISVEDLHELIGTDRCDLVTVYRCMATFEQHGLVTRSYRHSGTTIYERKQGPHQIYRVIDKVTHEAHSIGPEDSERIRAAIDNVERILRENGYAEVSHVLEFFAVQAPSAPARQNQPVQVPATP